MTYDMQSAADKYDFDITELFPWFQRWLERFTKTQVFLSRTLLYPTWRYDHAEGFLKATHYAVYSTEGHVHDYNPTKLYQLHLEKNIIRRSCFFLLLLNQSL